MQSALPLPHSCTARSGPTHRSKAPGPVCGPGNDTRSLAGPPKARISAPHFHDRAAISGHANHLPHVHVVPLVQAHDGIHEGIRLGILHAQLVPQHNLHRTVTHTPCQDRHPVILVICAVEYQSVHLSFADNLGVAFEDNIANSLQKRPAR